MYRPAKKRKKRGIRLDGTRSQDLCSGCLAFNCDPMSMSRKFKRKVHMRLEKGLCPACGNIPCQCKSGRRDQIGEHPYYNKLKAPF